MLFYTIYRRLDSIFLFFYCTVSSITVVLVQEIASESFKTVVLVSLRISC